MYLCPDCRSVSSSKSFLIAMTTAAKNPRISRTAMYGWAMMKPSVLVRLELKTCVYAVVSEGADDDAVTHTRRERSRMFSECLERILLS